MNKEYLKLIQLLEVKSALNLSSLLHQNQKNIIEKSNNFINEIELRIEKIYDIQEVPKPLIEDLLYYFMHLKIYLQCLEKS